MVDERVAEPIVGIDSAFHLAETVCVWVGRAELGWAFVDLIGKVIASAEGVCRIDHLAGPRSDAFLFLGVDALSIIDDEGEDLLLGPSEEAAGIGECVAYGDIDHIDLMASEDASHAIDEEMEVVWGDEVFAKSVCMVFVDGVRQFADIVGSLIVSPNDRVAEVEQWFDGDSAQFFCAVRVGEQIDDAWGTHIASSLGANAFWRGERLC